MIIQREDLEAAAARMADCIEEQKHTAAAVESKKLSSARVATILMRAEPREAGKTLVSMETSRAGRALARMTPEFAVETLRGLDSVQRRALVAAVPMDNMLDLLDAMSEEEREEAAASFEPTKRAHIEQVASIPAGSVGRLMSPHFVAVNRKQPVEETLDSLLSAPPEVERTPYIYVIDESGKALGVVSIKDMLRSDPQKPVGEVMNPALLTLSLQEPAREAALMIRNRRFTQLPVVDASGRVLGVFTFDDAMRVLAKEAGGRFTPAMAVAAEESFFTPPAKAVKGRLPWMAANVFLNMGAVAVITGFEDAILAVPILAAFIPMITDMGGNVGIQSLSVSIRSLALGEARPRDFRRVIRKELTIGVMNGLCLGLLFAVIAYFLRGNPSLGLLAGVALATNVLVAGVVGGLLPFLIRAIGKDPAMMTGPVLTTITDITGVGLYLGLATLFMSNLLAGG